MSELAVNWAKKNRREPQKPSRSPGEQKALDKLRAEAEHKGATLASNGEGGLPSSLVLGVMRRDGYRCKTCGTRENLSIHHKGGIVRSKWLSKKGHSNDPNNIVTICEDCHNKEHEQARADGVDSSQITPEGDKGDK